MVVPTRKVLPVKSFNTAGILMLLASIPVLISASAVVRAANYVGAWLGIAVALVATVAASVLCFRAVNDPAKRRPATILCGVDFGVFALATLVVLVCLVREVVAPAPIGGFGAEILVPAFSILLGLIAPVAVLSGVGLRQCLKGLRG